MLCWIHFHYFIGMQAQHLPHWSCNNRHHTVRQTHLARERYKIHEHCKIHNTIWHMWPYEVHVHVCEHNNIHEHYMMLCMSHVNTVRVTYIQRCVETQRTQGYSEWKVRGYFPHLCHKSGTDTLCSWIFELFHYTGRGDGFVVVGLVRCSYLYDCHILRSPHSIALNE